MNLDELPSVPSVCHPVHVWFDGDVLISPGSAVLFALFYCTCVVVCMLTERNTSCNHGTEIPGGCRRPESWRIVILFQSYGAVVPASYMEHFAGLVQRTKEYGGLARVAIHWRRLGAVFCASTHMLFHTIRLTVSAPWLEVV